MLIELTALDGKKIAINVYQIAQVFDTKKGARICFCDGLDITVRESLFDLCSLVNSRNHFIGPEYAVLNKKPYILEKGEKSEKTL